MTRSTTFGPRRSSLLATAAATVTILSLAACSSESSAGDAQSGASEADAAKYEELLDNWYEGTDVEPSGPAVEATPGKRIAYISPGESAAESADTTAQFVEAAEKLGWEVEVWDSRFDPNRYLTGVQQAVGRGVDGIATFAIDCAPMRAGLEAAKAAGIPVVALDAKECDPPLITYVPKFVGGQEWLDFFEDQYGKAQADYAIAKTGAETKAIVLMMTDAANTIAIGEGAIKELEACDTCEIVETVEFTGVELGPDLQAKVEQALIAHPEANALIASYDSALTTGGLAGIRAAGRLDDLVVVGGVGSVDAVESIKEGTGQDASAAYGTKFEALAAADALVRIFAGRDPAEVETGIGLKVYDADNNLPTDGSAYESEFDFPAAYYRMWGVE